MSGRPPGANPGNAGYERVPVQSSTHQYISVHSSTTGYAPVHPPAVPDRTPGPDTGVITGSFAGTGGVLSLHLDAVRGDWWDAAAAPDAVSFTLEGDGRVVDGSAWPSSFLGLYESLTTRR